MTMPIARDAFIRFLINAKRQTYASQGDEVTVTSLLAGSRQLEYREGNLLYRDIYFGSAFFVGQETVYYDAAPIWAMGYAGGITSTAVPTAQVYEFLRAALRQVTAERPYRGPNVFRERDYVYINETEGDVERFWGVETITYKGQQIYQLRYAGGLLRL
ncbi:DUF5680 domain-containing protein [Candidatus Acetothermia bacterium]|jgi:hypothetical protein|nr:DUF5680 domain-containing protein [Candidatus Acetothermia bacterium]MCI2431118.1 DUF5680 domain-containing protein [Candidatus Acetothermia bacterium]